MEDEKWRILVNLFCITVVSGVVSIITVNLNIRLSFEDIYNEYILKYESTINKLFINNSQKVDLIQNKLIKYSEQGNEFFDTKNSKLIELKNELSQLETMYYNLKETIALIKKSSEQSDYVFSQNNQEYWIVLGKFRVGTTEVIRNQVLVRDIEPDKPVFPVLHIPYRYHIPNPLIHCQDIYLNHFDFKKVPSSKELTTGKKLCSKDSYLLSFNKIAGPYKSSISTDSGDIECDLYWGRIEMLWKN